MTSVPLPCIKIPTFPFLVILFTLFLQGGKMSLNNSILSHGSNADIASLVNRHLLLWVVDQCNSKNHGRLLVSRSYSPPPSHSLTPSALASYAFGPRSRAPASRSVASTAPRAQAASCYGFLLLTPLPPHCFPRLPACLFASLLAPRREGGREEGGYTGWWVAYGRGRLF